MADLKPCPFCGSKAMHRVAGAAHYSVTCSNEQCVVGPIVTRRFVVDAETAWNTRQESV